MKRQQEGRFIACLCSKRLLLDCFEGNIDPHFISDMRRVFARVERRAPDGRVRICTDCIFFGHGMWHCVKRRHGQSYRFGHAFDREVPVDRSRLVAIECDFRRLECRGRVLRGIQKVFRLDMPIKRRESGVDRFHIDRDIHGRSWPTCRSEKAARVLLPSNATFFPVGSFIIRNAPACSQSSDADHFLG